MSTVEFCEQASRRLVEFQFTFERGELLGRLSILTSENKRRVRNLTASAVLLSTSVKMTGVVKEEFTRRRRTTFLDEPRSFLLLRAVLEKSKYQAMYQEKRYAMLEKVLVKYAETVIWDGILGPQELKARRLLEEVDEAEERQMLFASMQFQARYVDVNHACTLESRARSTILKYEVDCIHSIKKQFHDELSTIFLEAASDAIAALQDLEVRQRGGITKEEASVDVCTALSAEWLLESFRHSVRTEVIIPHHYHLFAAPTSASDYKLPSQQQLQSARVLHPKFFTRHLQYQVPLLISKESRERVFMMAMEENSWNNHYEKYHAPVITAWRRLVACRRIQAGIRGEKARQVLRLAHQHRTRELQKLRNAKLQHHVIMTQRFAQATLSTRERARMFAHTQSTTIQAFARASTSQKLCIAVNQCRHTASRRISKTALGFVARRECGVELALRIRMTNLREAKASQIQQWAKKQVFSKKARAATRAIVQRRHTAATTIQSLWKGVRAQRGFEVEGGLRSLLLEKKVGKLQRVLRGAVVRQMVFFPILRARLVQRFARAALSQRFIAVRRAIRPYVTLIHAVCLAYDTRRTLSVQRSLHLIELNEEKRHRAGETVTGFMKSAHRKQSCRRAFDARMLLLQRAVYLGPIVPIDTLNTTLNGYKGRKQLGTQLHKQRIQATILQQFCRRLVSLQMVQRRAGMHRMQCHLECIAKCISSWNAGHHIIPTQHHYVVQKLRSIKVSSDVLFRICSSYLQRKACGVNYISRGRNARRIQSAFRQHLARNEVNSKKDVQRRQKQVQKELRSASRLQKWWRVDICRKRYIAAATIQLFFHRCHPTITLRQEERNAKQGLWRFQRLQLERLATAGDDRSFIRGEEEEERRVLRDMHTTESLPLLRSSQSPNCKSTPCKPTFSQMPTLEILAQLGKIERREEFKRLLIEKEYLENYRIGGGDSKRASITEMYSNAFLPSLGGIYTDHHRRKREAFITRADTIRSRIKKEERNTRRNVLVYHYRRCDYLFRNIEVVDMMRKVDKCRDDVERSEANERKEMEDTLLEFIARCVDNQLLDDGEGSVFVRTLLQSSNPHMRLLSKDRQWTYENIVASRHQQQQSTNTATATRGEGGSIQSPLQRNDDVSAHRHLSSSFKDRVGCGQPTNNDINRSSLSKRSGAASLSSNPFLGLALPVVLPPQFTDSRAAALLVGSTTSQPFSRSAPIITDVAPSTTDRVNALHETRLTLQPPTAVDKVDTASAQITPYSSLSIENTRRARGSEVVDDASIGHSNGNTALRVVFPSPLWMTAQEQQALVNQSTSTQSKIPFDSYRTRVETCVANALHSIAAYASSSANRNNDDNDVEEAVLGDSGVYLVLDIDQHGECGTLVPLDTCLSTLAGIQLDQLSHDVIIRRLGFLEENVANLLRHLDTTRLESHRLMISGWRPKSETPPLLALIRSITALDFSPLSSGLWRSIHSEPALTTTATKVAARALHGLMSQINFLFGKGLTTLEIYSKQLALCEAGSSTYESTTVSNADATLASYRRALPPLETARAWLSQSKKRKQLMDDVASGTTQKKKAPTTFPPTAAPVRPTFDPQLSLFLPNVASVLVLNKEHNGGEESDAFRGECDTLHILAMIKGLELMLVQQSTFRHKQQQLAQVAARAQENVVRSSTSKIMLPPILTAAATSTPPHHE